MFVHVTLSLPVGSLIIYNAKSRTQSFLNKIMFWCNFNQDKRKLQQWIFSFSCGSCTEFLILQLLLSMQQRDTFCLLLYHIPESTVLDFCLLRTFLVVQQRNHHFVILSLGEMATRFTFCIQESKYSGESGADCVCVCVRACGRAWV